MPRTKNLQLNYLSNNGKDSDGGNEHGNILLGEVHHEPQVDKEAGILK